MDDLSHEQFIIWAICHLDEKSCAKRRWVVCHDPTAHARDNTRSATSIRAFRAYDHLSPIWPRINKNKNAHTSIFNDVAIKINVPGSREQSAFLRGRLLRPPQIPPMSTIANSAVLLSRFCYLFFENIVFEFLFRKLDGSLSFSVSCRAAFCIVCLPGDLFCVSSEWLITRAVVARLSNSRGINETGEKNYAGDRNDPTEFRTR